MTKISFDAQKYPTSPGVYLMRDAEGVVLYVGKAKNLRARLRSYFSAQGDGRAHIRFLMARVEKLETLVTDTEKEALILENTLIKQHRPRYNFDLRDDKTYVSLRLNVQEEFPALEVVRKVARDGALYFGPYTSSGAVRETLKLLYRIFPLRHYPLEICRRRGRPCLYHQLGQCCAPCHGKISSRDYRQLVDGVIALLSGHEAKVLKELRLKMQQASEGMRFEEAARVRDQIHAIEKTVEHQKVVVADGDDRDVFGLYREEGSVELAVIYVRNGKVTGRSSFGLQWRAVEDELLSDFLREFYSREVMVPKRILLPLTPEDRPALQEWLSERRGSKVELIAPQRGEALRLVEMATQNAKEARRERGRREKERLQVLQSLARQLQLKHLPKRIECFDISNVQGSQSVGSMAVLVEGEAQRSEYRRFKIRTVTGADDYASLREVLLRRLERGKREQQLPQMLLIDGGKGQLGVVSQVLDELDLQGEIDLAGIAKSRVHRNVRGKAVERSEERFFLPGRKNPVVLRAGSPELFLLERLRDEAHRFAITYHRQLRRKATLKSGLEEIPGVGPGRRKSLLKYFGSLKKVRDASLDELLAMPGLPERVARDILAYFHPEDQNLPEK